MDWMKLTLEEIVNEYKDSEPLDGDGVEHLVEIIKAKINLNEGNLTEYEYSLLMQILCD